MILTLKIVSCEIGEKFWGIVTIATGRITKFLNVKLERAKTVTDFIDSRNNNQERGNAKNKNWFEDDAANSGEHYDFLEYEGHLEVRTETAIFMVVEPHSGTNRKWMLRISTMRAFDRWANSTPIELFFDSDVKLCNYLHDNQLNIYKRLLKYLSEEYDDILDSYEEDKEWYEENLKKAQGANVLAEEKEGKGE